MTGPIKSGRASRPGTAVTLAPYSALLPRALAFVVVGVAAVFGCAGASPASPTEPSNAPAAAAPNEATTSEPVDIATPDPDAGAEPGLAADLTRASVPDAGPDFDLEAWAMNQGVKAELTGVDRCDFARLGDKPDTTIWCFRHGDTDTHVVYYQALYAARLNRVMKVFEIPVGVGPIAMTNVKEEQERYWVRLEVDVGRGKLRATVREVAGLGCDHASERASEAFPADPQKAEAARKVVAKVCMSRGDYRWAAGRLVRKW